MLRELAHLIRHAPRTLREKRRLPQAELYDWLMDQADRVGLIDVRTSLVGDLEGDILEVGCGTGLMFAHYRPGARVTAIEPDADFAARAYRRADAAAAEISLVAGSGESLAFADQHFDAVVFALVLCSVDDVGRVLAEARRVLRPGGALRLVEHVCSERRLAAAAMHAINPLWRALNGQGCNLDRLPLPAITAAGFSDLEVERFQLFPAGLPAFPMQAIRALR